MIPPHTLLLLLFLLAASALLSPASALPGDKTRCVLAVAEALSRLSFAPNIDPPPPPPPPPPPLPSQSPNATITSPITPLKAKSPFLIDTCTNTLRTYSLYAGVKTYCTPTQIQDGLDFLNQDCERGGLERTPAYESVEGELTEEYIAGLRVVEVGEVSRGVRLEVVVLVSRGYWYRTGRTNRAWEFETWAHHTFGFVSYWFWGIVILCGTLYRHLRPAISARLDRRRRGEDHQAKSPPSYIDALLSRCIAVHRWIRTNFIIPGAIGTYHRRLWYWCAVPTRIEAIVIVAFYALSLILTAVAYDLFWGNLFWDDPRDQFWRYFSDRTGIMSYSNLPLIWLFGQRNNALMPLTGWSFATFNLFHRAVARVATFQAIVHSIGYSLLTMWTSTYTLYWPSPWWYMGAVGTILMSLLLVFSSIWLRRNYYETFLLIHIIFSVVILFGLFIHTSIFRGEYDIYLWPIVGIWLFDRFLRIGRVLVCNFHVRFNKGTICSTKGVVSYCAKSDIVRLEIIPGSVSLRPKAGEYYYIYQQFKWTGYESHPFTLGSWTTAEDRESGVSPAWKSGYSTVPTPIRAGGQASPSSSSFSPAFTAQLQSPSQLSAKLSPGSSTEPCKLIFWIRPFDGWTKRLRADCLKSPTHTYTSDFLLEGPYGNVIDLDGYDNIVLVAGGTGIAAALPHIEEHIRRPTEDCEVLDVDGVTSSSSSASASSSLAATLLPPSKRGKTITLLWSVRDEEFIHSLMRGELAPALRRNDVKMHFYCTSSSRAPTDNKGTMLQPADENTSLLSDMDIPAVAEDNTLDKKTSVKIIPGRPDIVHEILSNLRDAVAPHHHQCGAKSAVLVCGPGGMADEARVAIYKALKGGIEVEYFEEAFGW
ncbi:hypothetical protein AJ80_07206 [Polytolypa hystricis UAMH7299]|uniref:FAD-binding FR-type domain-containing protein n=1 Tax=Polytolypa hystricis (strain UAMH7299) TaxID=1447883 RepID=A0A2B7XQ47_POLH7|nr:hypothetical protein AJ80_07206 [Polytolypa hystricis UAMH7299]